MKQVDDSKNKKKRNKSTKDVKKKPHAKKIFLFLIIIIFLLLIEFMLIKIYIQNLDSRKVFTNIYNLDVNYNDNYIFLGDSITERYPLNEFYSNIPVVNSGVGGDTTDNILSDMQNRVYRYNPTKVFILIGVNDMKQGKDNEYIYNNITKIVKKIKKNRPNAKIYVESLYPINTSDDEKINPESLINRTNAKIDDINLKLKEKYKDSDVTYIDVNSNLKENGMLKLSYTEDGIHLTPLGYIKVTSILLSYMQN